MNTKLLPEFSGENLKLFSLICLLQVTGGLDEKLVWLDEFNKNIIDYDKVGRRGATLLGAMA